MHRHSGLEQSRPHFSPSVEKPLLSLRGAGKIYQTAAGSFAALAGVDLDIHPGDFLAVVGKSGSGKSTLVNIMTGIDTPSGGTIDAGGRHIHSLTQEQLAIWRGTTVGVVFQFFQLLPTLTIAENIMLPMDFCNTFAPAARRGRAQMLLEKLGIGSEIDKLPADLSGGQQQRAAIARALANDPPILVADEPTGNLDSRTSDEVMGLFAGLAGEGRAVVMVTHERDLGRYFTRVIELADGRIVGQPGERP